MVITVSKVKEGKAARGDLLATGDNFSSKYLLKYVVYIVYSIIYSMYSISTNKYI